MPKILTYTDLFTHRKASVLPEAVQKSVRNLGISYHGNNLTAQLVSTFRNSLCDLPAESVPRGSYEIREFAQMWSLPGNKTPREGWWGLLRRRDDLLQEHPDLCWLLLFHGNGYVRQAAVEGISTPPRCPFEFAAIVYLLNDWVGNVRAASLTYAREYFPTTNSEVVGESTFFLLPQISHLKRWNDEALSAVKECIYRPAVLNKLKEQFLAQRGGRVGLVLRQILQRPDFDGCLEELALGAKLPSVRAIAVETLLMRRARWFVTYRREWVNKVYGITRREAEFETREVDIDFGTMEVLISAAHDRSFLVRKAVADFLIANRHDVTPQMAEIADCLKGDKKAAVNSRIEFFLKNISET